MVQAELNRAARGGRVGVREMEKESAAIKAYVKDLKGSGLLERPRKERFLNLLQVLFPEKAREIAKITMGAETSVLIRGTEAVSRGAIDTFFGDLIIEFEKKLPEKKTEAERQLKKYCSGIWNKEKKPRNYICIATDGIYWQTYAPVSEKLSRFTPQDIELKEKELIELDDTPARAKDFYYWLSRTFFREGIIKPTVAEFTRSFGIEGYLYDGVIKEIRRAFKGVKEKPSVKLAYDQWARYLRYTYGRLETTDDLFCRHTYLTVLARFIVWAALRDRTEAVKSHGMLIKRLLTGKYFEGLQIKNLVDKDFFYWVASRKAEEMLMDTWLELLNEFFAYDFDEIDEDLFKGVYQELVDPEDRHDLGEYYTPDWLCESIIQSLNDERKKRKKKGFPSMLDPTCGSGSFLRAGITALIKTEKKKPGKKFEQQRNKESLLKVILNNVKGIDIHPLAVTISKANYVLGLKDILGARKGPVEIPVYLADSLFSWAEKENENGKSKQLRLRPKTHAIKLNDKEYVFPDVVFNNKTLFDNLIRMAANSAEKKAAGKRGDSKGSYAHFLGKITKPRITAGDIETIAREMFELTQHLAEKIKKNEDTIWAFILRNNYAPAFLKEQFDIVFGNPPWITFNSIAEPVYQEEIRKFGIDRYGVAPRDQKLRTHMEIATVFLVHSVATYLKPGGLLGFVMPRSLFSADHHAEFRKESFKADCNIIEYWDLEKIKPLFNVPAAVVIAEKKPPGRKTTYPARVYKAKLPSKNLSLEEAKDYLEFNEIKLWFSRLGGRTALTREKLETTGKPYYIDKFRQGATIVPRNFYFIESPSEEDLQREILFVRTDPEQARTAKQPYKGVFLEGNIEREFLYRTAIAKHVLPFFVREPAWVVLPVLKGNGVYELKTAEELGEAGYPEAAEWFAEAEEHWNRLRGAKARKQGLYERVNYQNELMSQDPIQKFLSLYNSSGTNLSAALITHEQFKDALYVDSTLFKYYPKSLQEGSYLTGIMNSEFIDDAIKPFQARGLLGPRHIQKKVLEIPFPKFNGNDSLHAEIAAVTGQAEKKAHKFVTNNVLSKSLGRARNQVREAVADELKELDKLVRRLLKGIIA